MYLVASSRGGQAGREWPWISALVSQERSGISGFHLQTSQSATAHDPPLPWDSAPDTDTPIRQREISMHQTEGNSGQNPGTLLPYLWVPLRRHLSVSQTLSLKLSLHPCKLGVVTMFRWDVGIRKNFVNYQASERWPEIFCRRHNKTSPLSDLPQHPPTLQFPLPAFLLKRQSHTVNQNSSKRNSNGWEVLKVHSTLTWTSLPLVIYREITNLPDFHLARCEGTRLRSKVI